MSAHFKSSLLVMEAILLIRTYCNVNYTYQSTNYHAEQSNMLIRLLRIMDVIYLAKSNSFREQPNTH